MTSFFRLLPPLKAAGFFTALVGSAFSNSICGIGLGLYTGAWIAERSFSQNPPPAMSLPFFPLFTAMMASFSVSILLSPHTATSVEGFFKLAQGFLLFFAARDVIKKPSAVYLLIGSLIVAYTLAASSGIYQQFFGVDFLRGRTMNIYRDDIMRLTGPFKHCNDYGTFLVPGFPVFLALALWQKKKNVWFASGCLLLFLALAHVLYHSLSRGALLSAFISLFIFSLFFPFRKLAVPALLAALALFLWIPSPLQERLHELATHGAGDMGERMLLIQTTLRMIADSPLFGLGLNTYSDHFPLYKPADYPAAMYAHNSYLQMASEAGIVGTALYFTWIAAALNRTVNRLRASSNELERLLGPALFSGCVGFLVNCAFDSAMQSTQLRFLFWCLLGCLAALSAGKTYETHHSSR